MTTVSSPLAIAVIGSGIAGLAASWLLEKHHDVTLYERAPRLGGHSNTVDVADEDGNPVAVDTGFIVYNTVSYPNLVALFEELGVATHASDMSFSVSLEGGGFEYSGTDLKGLLAQPTNLLRPRFWGMVRGILRFYREAPALLAGDGRDNPSLGAFLERGRYPRAFIDDHILPMGAAIWSASEADMRRYPAQSFIRFFENHGLLRVAGRPQWRTVTGGSRTYVARMMAPLGDCIRLGSPIRAVRRHGGFVMVEAEGRPPARFDHVVIAAHADDALSLLSDADGEERRLLGAFRYAKNRAVLHCDPSFMPRRRRAWASWNYLGGAGADVPVSVTYWMNLLQKLACRRDFFVTLNPAHEPRGMLASFAYDHPGFDAGAIAAQRELWSLQGRRRTWFCGAHFGAGFHEDALQSGLAVAEALGGVRRPWRVANESGRIVLAPRALLPEAAL